MAAIRTFLCLNKTFFLLRKKASFDYCTFAHENMIEGSLAQLD